MEVLAKSLNSSGQSSVLPSRLADLSSAAAGAMQMAGRAMVTTDATHVTIHKLDMQICCKQLTQLCSVDAQARQSVLRSIFQLTCLKGSQRQDHSNTEGCLPQPSCAFDAEPGLTTLC